jgi:hypothetical protein
MMATAKIVVLDPFTSQNGPDLKLYLSKDQNASQYINLVALKSTTVNIVRITGTPDLAEYKFVLVWCPGVFSTFWKSRIAMIHSPISVV